MHYLSGIDYQQHSIFKSHKTAPSDSSYFNKTTNQRIEIGGDLYLNIISEKDFSVHQLN